MRLTHLLASIALLLAFSATDTAAATPPVGTIQRQNWLADRYKLTRLRDRAQLKRFIGLKLLVPVTDTPRYFVSPRNVGSQDKAHAVLYRYARSWVVEFLNVFVEAVNQELDRPYRFKVTSLVRTKAYQRRLARANRYAATGGHYDQSPHLTGATVDISIRGMPEVVKRTLLRHLRWLQEDGAIDFIHERRNNCLHIFVVPDWRDRCAPYPIVGC